jgi:hypothetical protein
MDFSETPTRNSLCLVLHFAENPGMVEALRSGRKEIAHEAPGFGPFRRTSSKGRFACSNVGAAQGRDARTPGPIPCHTLTQRRSIRPPRVAKGRGSQPLASLCCKRRESFAARWVRAPKDGDAAAEYFAVLCAHTKGRGPLAGAGQGAVWRKRKPCGL